MNRTYIFKNFSDSIKKSEIVRLSGNVASHSKILCEHFLNNGLSESGSVLDIGCGTGAMLHMFSNILPEAGFTGVDESFEILQSSHKIKNHNVELITGKGSSLPFKDNVFDFVYARLVLLHNRKPEEIVKEMKRVCRPGGIIVNVEIDDGTLVFYPFAFEFNRLINAYIEYSRLRGMDRIMGRKLFSIYKSAGIEEVKVITQTTDFTDSYNIDSTHTEVPFPLRLTIGQDDARHLVEAKLITEKERLDYLRKIKIFSETPDRYFNVSFMYCFGKKK